LPLFAQKRSSQNNKTEPNLSMKHIPIIRRILLPLLLVGVLAILSTAAHMFTLDMKKLRIAHWVK
jgi:hypothetical protein